MSLFRISLLICILFVFSQCKKPNKSSEDHMARGDNYEILKVTNNPKGSTGTDMPPLSDDTIFQKGTNLEALEKNTLACFTYFWETTIKNMEISDQLKGKVIIRELPGSIKIKPLSDNIAIVTWPRRGMDTLQDVSDIQDIWVLRNDVWLPEMGEFIPGKKAILVDLNGDGDEDIVLEGGCCDSTIIDIFINQKGKSVRYVQSLTIIGQLDISYKKNCQANMTVKHYQHEKQVKSLKFNCRTNRFE